MIRFWKNAAASLISCTEQIGRNRPSDIMHPVKPAVNFSEFEKSDKFALISV